MWRYAYFFEINSYICTHELLKSMNKKDKETMIQNLEKEMREAARVLDFERAAELRDMLMELRSEG